MIRLLVRVLFLLVCLFAQTALAAKDVVVLNSRLSDDAAVHPPVVYWPEVRNTPRPLHIHVVQVDLRAPGFEMAALIAKDPDGDGPAEAWLEKPAYLAHQPGVVAAVNANAFGPVPPLPPGEKAQWKVRLPVDIASWALNGLRQASVPQPPYGNFWVDQEGRPHIGVLSKPVEARVAVAGFGVLLQDGRGLPLPQSPLHPRTAVGINREGTALWMVVVDGRRRSYSEGMSEGELAGLMKQLGCWQALNLDGGGSSVLLVAAGWQGLRVMNRPSDRGGTRPIPVMLAVRRR